MRKENNVIAEIAGGEERKLGGIDQPLQAKAVPPWLMRSVIYQVFLRSFTPEVNLSAATARLPELKTLGVDVIYLSPVCLQDEDLDRRYWSPRQSLFENPRNPYRVKDYYKIDPEYGTESDLKTFVRTAHELGFRVLLDIVYMHCGPNASFIQEHPDFVQWEDGQVKITSYHFPLINFESETLREYLIQNMEYWVREFEVDGYRCDVSNGAPLEFWEAARARIEQIAPEVIMLAEGNRIEDQLKAFDMSYCFRAAFGIHKVFFQSRPASTLREISKEMKEEYPRNTRFIRYIENHDIAHDTGQGCLRRPFHTDESWARRVNFQGLPAEGLQPNNRPDVAWGFEAVNCLLVYCFTQDGIPLLYNGQEVADVSMQNIFGNVAVEWSRLQTPEGMSRYRLCQDLCRMRHEEAVLADGDMCWLDTPESDRLLHFSRSNTSETIVVLLNVSKDAVVIGKQAIDISAFRTLISSGIHAEGDEIHLSPYAYYVGKMNR
jgi:glycosidase